MKKLGKILCAELIGLAGLGLGLSLSGCEKSVVPTINMQTENQTENQDQNQESRYSVKRVDVFEDGLAYGNQRGIYEITDKQTNKKYLGVSGIGISEVLLIQKGRIAVWAEE